MNTIIFDIYMCYGDVIFGPVNWGDAVAVVVPVALTGQVLVCTVQHVLC